MVTKSNLKAMLVTKKEEELYLVYTVNPQQEVSVGKLNLSIIAKKKSDSYSPWLLPLERLHEKKEEHI